MAVASATGLLTGQVYQDGTAVDAALRAGDLLNLLAAPVLTAAVLVSGGSSLSGGSSRARALWLGMLAYTAYAYGYYVFTPTFNDLFLVHVFVFVAAMAGLVAVLTTTGPAARGGAHLRTRRLRTVAVFLLLVAAALVWTWGSASIRFALTGEPPADVLPFPEWRVHLGYVMDLVFVVPAAAVAGMLLWRRSPWGELLGAAVAIWLFVYQLNFLVTTVFLADADVPGVTVDAVPIVTCVVFAVPPALLLWRRQASAHAASTIRSPGHRKRS